MKLNIVTAGANSVGQALLKKLATPNEVTISLSRRWVVDLPHMQDVRITDLTDLNTTKKELHDLFTSLQGITIDHICLFHNCCYAIAEIPDLDPLHPLATNPKLKKIDADGDGLDDRTYHALLTTFRNVFSLVSSYFPEHRFSVWAICSLTDKKSYIPTIFYSMVRTNLLVREELQSIVHNNSNIHVSVVSASTVATETEVHFRPYSEDKDYRVTVDQVAKALIDTLEVHTNIYEDNDLFIVHPEREHKFKDETDEQMTARLMKEIGVL